MGLVVESRGRVDCQNTSKMADAAVIEKLEAGFKKVSEATNCKSLLKKYLTKEVFDQLKGKKTSLGATLLDVIQSGVENLDSGVGVYAPDAEAYSLFAPLFDPIIEDYHVGFSQTDKHPAKDFGDTSSLVDVDPEGKYVVSTRVRCGRSLEGYPFNPCLTESNYKEMEAKVSSTLATLEGELKGTYHPLLGMSKEVQQQLIDDHFLFKEGDRFLLKPTLAVTGPLVAVSTTTTPRPSWSGVTRRIISASSPCRWVVTSVPSSVASPTPSTRSRSASPSLTTTVLVSSPSAPPTLAPLSVPPSTSRSPSSLLTTPSWRPPPPSTTSRSAVPPASTPLPSAASTTSPTRGAWDSLSTSPSRRCRMVSLSSSSWRRKQRKLSPFVC